MLSPKQAIRLIEESGFTVVDVVGYEFLPFRREGARLVLPRLRARIENRLAERRKLNWLAGSFVLVARPVLSSGDRR